MAGNKNSGGSGRIKPGEVRNPLGANAHEFAVLKREFRMLTEKQFQEVMSLVLECDPSTLGDEVAKQPTVLKMWVAKAAEIGVKTGNLDPLMQLMDRICGKPKERGELNVKSESKNPEELRKELEQIMQKVNANRG